MRRRYVRPANVAVVASRRSGPDDQFVAYLALLPLGPAQALDEMAHLVWATAVAVGDEEHVVQLVAEATGSQPANIRSDVIAFLQHLVSQRLLLNR